MPCIVIFFPDGGYDTLRFLSTCDRCQIAYESGLGHYDLGCARFLYYIVIFAESQFDSFSDNIITDGKKTTIKFSEKNAPMMANAKIYDIL